MNEEENVSVENLKKEKTSGFLKNIFLKIKKIKHVEIILTIFFISIILLIYFSSFSYKTSSSKLNDDAPHQELVVENENESSDSILLNYQNQIEAKIKKVISQLEDVGQVSVFVNFDGDIKENIAYTTKTEYSDDGVKTETKTPVLVTENGKTQTLIIERVLPDISNIMVVASGAKNTKARLEIIRAIQSMFNNPNLKIEIFVGK